MLGSTRKLSACGISSPKRDTLSVRFSARTSYTNLPEVAVSRGNLNRLGSLRECATENMAYIEGVQKRKAGSVLLQYAGAQVEEPCLVGKNELIHLINKEPSLLRLLSQ